MLSRTANQLYWLSRYMERAENLVRVLDVSFNVSLIPDAELGVQELSIPLVVTSSHDDYFVRYSNLSRNNILSYFTLDEQNSNSISSCFSLARDNAKAVRSILSAEVWESLNSAWIELQNKRRGGPIIDARDFFDWVKAQSHLFRGAVYGTILRNDTFRFLRLGTFVERADNTARILASKAQFSEDENQSLEYHRWHTLLRALGAFEAYHQIYGDQIHAKKVTELLVLREEVPRSLLSCLEQIYEIIVNVEGKQGKEAKRLIGAAYCDLKYGNTRYIFKCGLDNYLQSFLDKLNIIALNIHNAYMESI